MNSFLKNTLSVIISVLVIVWVVHAVNITNFTQTATTWDKITSSWINAVNTALKNWIWNWCSWWRKHMEIWTDSVMQVCWENLGNYPRLLQCNNWSIVIVKTCIMWN